MRCEEAMIREKHPSPNFGGGGTLRLWQVSLRIIEIKCGFTNSGRLVTQAYRYLQRLYRPVQSWELGIVSPNPLATHLSRPRALMYRLICSCVILSLYCSRHS